MGCFGSRHSDTGPHVTAFLSACRTYEALVLQSRPCSCGSDGPASSASSLPALITQALQAAFDASPSAFLQCSLDVLTDPDRALRNAASNFLQVQLEAAFQTPRNGMCPPSGSEAATVISRAALLSEHVQAWAPERLKRLAEGVLPVQDTCNLACRTCLWCGSYLDKADCLVHVPQCDLHGVASLGGAWAPQHSESTPICRFF